MSERAAHEVGIVDYPGAQVACILGLTDLFRIACTIALDQRRSGQAALRVTHWKPIDASDTNLSCIYDSAPRDSPQPRTLIIPPTMVDPDPDIPAGVVSWVRNRHAAGTALVSLCSGAFILAATGLMEAFSENRRRHKSAHHRSWRHHHGGRFSVMGRSWPVSRRQDSWPSREGGDRTRCS
jgi:transcriptional regulator GlxA family with amidase domain